MRTKVIFVLIPVAITLSIPSSNASIFGKSKCERVADQIAKDDLIGKNLWVNLNESWKARRAANSTQDNLSIVYAMENLWNQYIKIFQTGINNSNCYSAKQVAAMITAQTEMRKALRNAKSWESARTWDSFPKKNNLTSYYSFKDLFPK